MKAWLIVLTVLVTLMVVGVLAVVVLAAAQGQADARLEQMYEEVR